LPAKSGGSRFAATIRITKAKGTSYRAALGEMSPHERSSVKVTETAAQLEIEITAKDAAALRATLNSALKDLHVAESVAGL